MEKYKKMNKIMNLHMKKNLSYAALAIMALVSCTSNDYVGDQSQLDNAAGNKAIQFASNTPSVTRAVGDAAASELGYSFAVYATKKVSETESNVFAHNAYSPTTNTPYWVWYATSSANTTTSNTSGWEYVGVAGNKQIPNGTFNLTTDQTIKFWDYAASQYDFTAYKNKSEGTVSNVTTSGFTFVGNATQFAGLYIADKLTITEKNEAPTKPSTGFNKMGDIVKFTFRSAAAKVRLGIYETIPGYNVKNVNFKPTSPATFSETTTNAQLSGSFNGSSPSTSQTFTVTYGTGGVAQLATTTDASNNYEFGSFDTDGSPYLGESATDPTWANASSDYISVLPNQDHTGMMVLSVDFDLYNTVTQETIHVEDAKAVVPQAYMTWNPNYAYTYLFKICDNTNGYTGSASNPRGLFPITFDAVTVETDGASQQGTITTLSTPAITTYQAGSVSSAGITYANAKGPIYITVNTDGTLATLNASGTSIKLYTVADGTTEADLMLASAYPKTEVTSGDDVMTVQTSNVTVNNISFTANQYATFTPINGKTYAFEYTKDAVGSPFVAASGTYVSGTKYYTTDTGATEVDTSGFVAGTTDVSSYYVANSTYQPAIKVYKIIQVVAAP